ncbi:hypothetical protein EcWSU1_01651 [Enterobacter ludwigii]|uniref:Uncharacterized protein n=1 Tax=Enterobacter ludwigii TaxID=299767 RepID=G8LJH0_9ENTR|nr:hypothetical protein EcWSU1_01651 [Enterobacter ludwigii]
MNFLDFQAKKSRGDPAKKHNEGAVLICDEPVVGAFPRFLQDFGDTRFIFFRAANDGEVVCGRVTHRYGTVVFGKGVVNTTG